MIDYSEFRCPRKTQPEIGRVACDFRNAYWNDKPFPIDMEMLISKELGLEVIPEPHISVLAKTDAYLQSDCTAIIIDMNQYMDDYNRYDGRLRFAMAHEVGHYVFHKSLYESLEINTIDQYLHFIENTPEEEYKAFEWQANEFAGSLLVPKDILVNEILKVVEKINNENIAHLLPKYSNDILMRNLEILAKPFGVSTQVIERRVHIEKLWPPREELF